MPVRNRMLFPLSYGGMLEEGLGFEPRRAGQPLLFSGQPPSARLGQPSGILLGFGVIDRSRTDITRSTVERSDR